MFLGSGMPSNLWRRVVERFPGSRVLEFYASAEGSAILANLTGNPIGSLGRPLPGTPPVRVAAFEQDSLALEVGPNGLVRECEPGEVGLLLARVEQGDTLSSAPLRGVFEPEDAWQSTGDLFRRDEYGELWLVDQVAALIRTRHGTVSPAVARRAAEAIPAVDLTVAYGVPDEAAEREGEAGCQVLVVTVTVVAGAELTASELNRAYESLPPAQRPDYVQVIPSLPVTTWCRPLWRPLREAGVPSSSRTTAAWRLDPDRQHYHPL
jgi:putative long chain acyl-CoA synthase